MRLMSMATCLPSSRCPVVFVKAVPCPPCCMFSMLKFLPVISVPTPPSRASSCQGSQSPFQSSPSMRMIRLWLRCPTRLSLRFSPPTRFLKRVLGLALTLVNVGACGLAHGRTVRTPQSTCSGCLTRLKFLAFTSAREFQMKITGVPASLRLKMS